jgi:hypothetical protein
MAKSFFRWITVMLLPLILAGLHLSVVQSQQGSRGVFRNREPNVHVPNLYADKLTLKITVVNLPGANDPRSYSECSYQVFFVPEDKYYEALQALPGGAQNLAPAQFPGRMLIAEGTIKKNVLTTIGERTFTRSVPFKAKIPDAQQTKFARLMFSYAVKIFDGKLNRAVYRSGVFLNFPFDDSSNQSSAWRRETLYLNFLVTDGGELYRSQWARKDGDTSWDR